MNLYSTLDISAAGLAAQRKRVEILAQNIANSETTRTPGGGPYRRRQVVFESGVQPGSFAAALREVSPPAPGFRTAERDPAVRVSRVRVDPTPPERRYEPWHPDAGPDGYVAYPAFNPVEDMVDLSASVRSYQANLAVAEAVKQMLNRTVELARG